MEAEKVRIGKWLWVVRIFKTRLLSADMCKRGAVTIDGQRVKASHMISVGNRIAVRRKGITWTYEVIRCVDKRVSAKIACECRKDLTPESEILKYQMSKRIPVPRRSKGAGRPSKKERRQLEKFFGMRLIKKVDY